MNKISFEECVPFVDKLMASPNESPGLSGGMMGQCLFYYWMSRKTHREEYEETADKLLEEVLDNLKSNQVFTFENGLLGTGWALNHLLQYEFVSGEADGIFEELDYLARIALSQIAFNPNLFFDFGLYFTGRYLNTKQNEFASSRKKIKHDLLTLLLQLNFFVERSNPDVFFKYAKESNSSFVVNNPLFKSLYILIQCYKSGIFNYRVLKFIRYFFKILIDCREQLTLQNRKYLCLLINNFKEALGEQENNDITDLITNYFSMEKSAGIANDKDNPEFFTDGSCIYLFTNHIFIPLISITG